MESTNRVRGGRALPLPPIGRRLTAYHRGRSRSATIVAAAEFTSGRGVRAGRRVYASLSGAGAAITGYQVNGWRFWRAVDEAGRVLERGATA